MFISGSRGANYRAQCRHDDIFTVALSIFGDSVCGICCVSPSGDENFEEAPGFLENVFNILHNFRDHCHVLLRHTRSGAVTN
jgi:hypothetical protein